jgi:hypothetical protein
MMSIFQPLMAMSMHEYIHSMHDPNLVDLSRVCHIPLKGKGWNPSINER